MCDEWMPNLQLSLTWDEFLQLPRHSAYRYEYLKGQAFLSPRPQYYHAVLDLAQFAEPEPCDEIGRMRSIEDSDRTDLEALFCGAFSSAQPFASVNEKEQPKAARACMERVWNASDGPWIRQSSLIAFGNVNEKPIGACFITLVPPAMDGRDQYLWQEPPPEGCIERREGRAHLTWIFVSPWESGHGVATALLFESVKTLRVLGFDALYSTFLKGNDASALWHWRSGFRLLEHAGSNRRIRRLNQKHKPT